MTKELQVVEQREVLGKNFRIYGNVDEPLFLAKDVADWIEYSASNVSKLVGVVDEDEKVRTNVTTLGGTQETWFLTEDGLYEILMQSRKPIAKVFKKKVKEILKTIRKTGHYETAEYKAILELKANQEELKKLLVDSGVLRTGVSDRHTFDRLNVRYKIATGDDGHRGFYDAIGNYFGVAVPYSNTINVTVKDWIIAKFDMDELQQFVLGIESSMIVKSIQGAYVNLHGFGGNNIEWQKILSHWDNSCAYCNTTSAALIPEHIISQSYLSQSNPEAVDLIGNLTCSCGACNKAKGTLDVDEFFDNNPQLKRWRLDKIHRWQSKHRI